MKAMIMAAGRGNRLRPLTDSIPKPLVLVAGKPLIEYHIEKLVKAGIREIIINISYLGEKIVETIGDGKRWGIKVLYSKELEPLEVAGGIMNALPLLGEKPFLLVNADIWTDYPFETLIEKATQLKKSAHIILVNNLSKHPEGDFGIEGEILSLTQRPKFTYSGIAIYTPEFFKGQGSGKVYMRPLLDAAIGTNNITGEYYAGTFYDIGTIEFLEELNASLSTNMQEKM